MVYLEYIDLFVEVYFLDMTIYTPKKKTYQIAMDLCDLKPFHFHKSFKILPITYGPLHDSHLS